MNRSSSQVRIWLVVLIAVLVAGSFVAGIGVRHSPATGPLLSLVGRVAQIVPGVVETEEGVGITASTDLQPLATFWQVREKILSDFVDPVEEPAELTYGAIRGMVAALGDPYSRFMTPEQYDEFKTEASGQFEGIGAYLEERTVGEAGQIEVVIFSIIPGGPASEADIRPGDIVLGVDNESVKGKHVSAVAELIRGPEGTQVTLTLRRQGCAEPLTVPVSRRQVTLPPPEHEVIDEKIGYVWLHTFNKQAEAQLREAIDELLAENIEALLLDLSDNGGGLLDQAISVTSLFYEDDPVVYVRERGRQLQPLNALSDQAIVPADMPVVVLVTAGSASASEIVAGALQDLERATVVGQNTFGKAKVQTLIPLNDGSALALSTAVYLTPSKRDLSKMGDDEKRGVKPDIQLPGFEPDGSLTAREWHDNMVDQAVDVLKQELAG